MLEDIQVPEQSATLEALRKVSHYYHNNSSLTLGMFSSNTKGETLGNIVMIFLQIKGCCTTRTNVYPIGNWSQDQRIRGFDITEKM